MPSFRSAFLLASTLCLATATSLRAQEPWKRRIDIAIGMHTDHGGSIRDRSGMLLDALVAGERTVPNRWSLTGGGGVSLYAVRSTFGANPDECVLASKGGCEWNGAFSSIYAVGGVSRPVGASTVRALVGPTVVRGVESTSIGMQAQVDINRPFASRAGIGAMVRATLQPKHVGQQLTLLSGGVSIAFR